MADMKGADSIAEQAPTWWAVALADEVKTGAPFAAFALDEPIVLFRDGEGQVRALEDRCPHRRVPLSLGKVTPQGWLQCGYHGWSFDGGSGRCTAIPSLRHGEKIPAVYGVFSYGAAEQDGLIHVSTARSPALPPPPRHVSPVSFFSGRTMIGLAAEEYISALLDGPQLLLRSAGIRIADIMVSDLRSTGDGWLMMERAAFWVGQVRFDGLVNSYELIFRLELNELTGEAWGSFVRPDGAVVARIHLCPTTATRGVTAILWRAFASDAGGSRSTMLRAASSLSIPPIVPRSSVDMAALAKLLVGPSDLWRTRDRQSNMHLFGEALNNGRARQ